MIKQTAHPINHKDPNDSPGNVGALVIKQNGLLTNKDPPPPKKKKKKTVQVIV